MRFPFFTIGHSNHSIAQFAELLKSADANLVVDVRTITRSRANPQFNSDVLPDSLHDAGIGYRHIAALGGLRSRSSGVPPDVNSFWENRSFHNYADYAMGDEFRSGLNSLLESGRDSRCAIMCAEAVWWRCHRRIIADHLIAAGEQVFHILTTKRMEAARITAAASFDSCGRLTYPASPGARP